MAVLQFCILPIALLSLATAAADTSATADSPAVQQQVAAAAPVPALASTPSPSQQQNALSGSGPKQQQQVASAANSGSNSELGQQMVSSSAQSSSSPTLPAPAAAAASQPAPPSAQPPAAPAPGAPQVQVPQPIQPQQQQQLKLPKINLYVSEIESKKLLGITKRIEYVTNGNVNAYPFLFAIPLGYNQADTIFTWQNLGQTNVNYSISLAISNIQAVDPPLINITRAGLIPRQEQVFKITLPCSGKLTDEVDVQILIDVVGQLESAPQPNADTDDEQPTPTAGADDDTGSTGATGKAARSRRATVVAHKLAIKRKKLCLAAPQQQQAAVAAQHQLPAHRPATSVWPANNNVQQMHQAPGKQRLASNSGVHPPPQHPAQPQQPASAEPPPVVPAHSASFAAAAADQLDRDTARRNHPTAAQVSAVPGPAAVAPGLTGGLALSSGKQQPLPHHQYSSYPNWPSRMQPSMHSEQQQVSSSSLAPPDNSINPLSELLLQLNANANGNANAKNPFEAATSKATGIANGAGTGTGTGAGNGNGAPVAALLLSVSLVVSLALIAVALFAANQRKPFDKINSITSRLLLSSRSRAAAVARARARVAQHAGSGAHNHTHRNNSTGIAAAVNTISGGKQRQSMFGSMMLTGTTPDGKLTRPPPTAADLIASSLRNGPLKSTSTHIDLTFGGARHTHSPAQQSHTGSGSGSSASNNSSINKFGAAINFYGTATGHKAHQHQQQPVTGAYNNCYNQSIYSVSTDCQVPQAPLHAQPPTADLLGTGYQCSAAAMAKQQQGTTGNNNQIYHIGLPNNNQTTRLVWHASPHGSSANGSYTIDRSHHQQQQNNYTSLHYQSMTNEPRSDTGSVYQTIY